MQSRQGPDTRRKEILLGALCSNLGDFTWTAVRPVMKRIFLFLAALTVLALCITYAVGLLSWSRDGLTNVHDSTYLVHFYLGLYTIIGVLMIHCPVITYFPGTGRSNKELTLAYDLPEQRWARP